MESHHYSSPALLLWCFHTHNPANVFSLRLSWWFKNPAQETKPQLDNFPLQTETLKTYIHFHTLFDIYVFRATVLHEKASTFLLQPKNRSSVMWTTLRTKKPLWHPMKWFCRSCPTRRLKMMVFLVCSLQTSNANYVETPTYQCKTARILSESLAVIRRASHPENKYRLFTCNNLRTFNQQWLWEI